MISPLSLRLVGLAAFCSMASMRICDPMLIALGREFDVSTGDASRVISGFAIAYGLMQLIYGPLGDRIGKLRVIVLASFGCALFSATTAMAQGYGLLVLSRVAMGAAAAGIVPLSIAWIGDQVPYAQRQETLARLMGATLTGMMVGQWFGGFAADHMGWRSAFMVLAGLFLLVAIVLYRNFPTPAGPARDAGGASAGSAASLPAYARNALRLLARPRVRWVLVVTAIEGALAFGALAFIPSRLVATFGFSMAGAGGVMVLYGAGGLLYSQLAGRWLALLGEKGLALGGGALMSVGLLVLASSTTPWLAMLACLLAGLGFYMLHNTLQTQATQMAPESRGTAVSLFACVLFLGQSLGVLIMAYCADRGILSLAIAAVAMTILALGAWVSRSVQGRARAHMPG
ncbi:MAG: MFS transporter [Rhodoferax sp.]|nr:MFS transporter [Rhodoferax sp.]MBP9930023.1 MFS transporter [Rhodoferax sp.]HQZ05586.1 MFS transporter [Burkholderiaceae bacterium]HRA62176.1 MFS transporter [Burkholderiaceae bacterium]